MKSLNTSIERTKQLSFKRPNKKITPSSSYFSLISRLFKKQSRANNIAIFRATILQSDLSYAKVILTFIGSSWKTKYGKIDVF